MGILRLLLALSVVFNHLPWNNGLVIVGGRVAVQLFYIISGFLIAYILNSTDRYKDVRKFYVSRWLRIYPIYYVVAAASLVTNLVGNPQFSALYASIPLDAALQLILSNLFIFGQDWTMFLGVSAGHLHAVADYRNSDVELFHGLLIPPAWTLGVELTFYLIAPFVLRSKRATFALLGLSILVRLVLMQLGLAGKDPWTYRFFPAELSLFLFGAISSQYLLPRWVKSTEAGPLRHAPAWAVSIIALVCLGYYYIPAEEWLKDSLLLTSFGILVPLTFIFQNRTPLDSVIGQLRADATINSHRSDRVVPGWQRRVSFEAKTTDLFWIG